MGTRRTRAVLAVVAVALMTVVSAVSGLNVALPDLARSTGASQTQLTWIVDAYTVVFAGLLLFAGALGDRFGRKHLLTAGLVIFGLAAAGGMVTEDPTLLIGAPGPHGSRRRGDHADDALGHHDVLQRVGPAEGNRRVGGRRRGRCCARPLRLRALLEYFAWNSFFALNVVLAAVALVGTLLVVPNSVDQDAPALDIGGAVLSLVPCRASSSGSSRGRSGAGGTS